jgi:hypothetical protein
MRAQVIGGPSGGSLTRPKGVTGCGGTCEAPTTTAARRENQRDDERSGHLPALDGDGNP